MIQNAIHLHADFLPSFDAALNEMAKDGIIIDYTKEDIGSNWYRIKFGESDAGIMFRFGSKFERAKNLSEVIS